MLTRHTQPKPQACCPQYTENLSAAKLKRAERLSREIAALEKKLAQVLSIQGQPES